jgi:hypothetical protein
LSHGKKPASRKRRTAFAPAQTPDARTFLPAAVPIQPGFAPSSPVVPAQAGTHWLASAYIQRLDAPRSQSIPTFVGMTKGGVLRPPQRQNGVGLELRGRFAYFSCALARDPVCESLHGSAYQVFLMTMSIVSPHLSLMETLLWTGSRIGIPAVVRRHGGLRLGDRTVLIGGKP